MIKQILILTFLAFSLPQIAQAEIKDSFYFMKDDGIFSDEEKDEEAQYIYQVCENNNFQKIYFDCACIAGDFRNQRESELLIPQGEIYSEITDNPRPECINTTSIAGDTFKDCMEYSQTFRSRANNNVDYCECSANRAARDFRAKPDLRLKNIEKIRSNAMVSCARTYTSPPN